ncbi:MAG TPA: ABC transporter substrate-binding protein [Pseudonocardiaceae bacterium]|jgi:ABC-type branched-subunit amino acid transport system substrate-binding protein|nr:ABC transporter substrate-binding protein [Pseudonocardiaceae bacterium]
MTRSTRLRAITAISAMTALSIAACGSGGGGSSSSSAASAPGVTATTVTIGSTQPLTGPAAPGYSEIAPATKAYFDYVNANGGINGRKITLKYLDDGYNPTQTVTLTKQLVLQDKVFAVVGSLGTPTHTKVVDFLNSERVPDLFVASGCTCWDAPKQHPYTFGWQPDYTREGKILGQYITQKFAGKKVAYFSQDDDFGRDGVKGLDDYIPGTDVLSRQTYQPGATDIQAQVQAIAAKKPDVVVLDTIPAYTALFKLTSLKLGFNPTMVVSNVGSDPSTLEGLVQADAKAAGASISQPAQLIEGIISDTYLPSLGDASNSWITLFKKIHDQYVPKLPFDGNVVYGMAYGYTFAQALAKAGKNPTRQGLVNALQQGKLTGPGITPFAYSANSHAGYTGVQVGTIHNGALVTTGTPMTTDDAKGSITAYTATPATAPANGIPTG